MTSKTRRTDSGRLASALRSAERGLTIAVEAREFDDRFRRNKTRVRFFTLTCGSGDHQWSQAAIDFSERALYLAVFQRKLIDATRAMLGVEITPPDAER